MAAGRNFSGRITIFHRGGGAKRLQRKIDLKRSSSSVGIVEKIDYDPNRSSRIAQVRWNGVSITPKRSSSGPLPKLARDAMAAASHTNPSGITSTRESARSFAFASMPGKSHIAASKDVLFNAFSSPKANNKGAAASSLSLGSSFLGFPRMAVAGAKPPFFVLRKKEKEVAGGESTFFSLGEIREWRRNSILWAHRIGRKAALPWQTILGRSGASEHNNNGEKLMKNMDRESKSGKWDEDRVPVTYVIASHQLVPGKMVMNYNWPKPSN